MQMNPYFPFSTIRVLRGAIAAQLHGRFPSFHSAAFRAIWEKGQDLSKEEALRRLLKGAEIDPALIEGDDIKNRLRANVDDAISRGAFGAPTFFVNGEMLWGNDRLEFVEAASCDRRDAGFLVASSREVNLKIPAPPAAALGPLLLIRSPALRLGRRRQTWQHQILVPFVRLLA